DRFGRIEIAILQAEPDQVAGEQEAGDDAPAVPENMHDPQCSRFHLEYLERAIALPEQGGTGLERFAGLVCEQTGKRCRGLRLDELRYEDEGLPDGDTFHQHFRLRT